MATQIQFRRGTGSQHVGFTGATAEVTVNTTNKSLHVHDGTTAGGFELARTDLANTTLSGDATSSGTTLTLATVNSDVGTFGDGGSIPSITVNAKGLITGVSTAAIVSGITVTDDTTTNATRYVTFTSATSGSISGEDVSSTKLTYNPSTGTLTATDINSSSDITLKENVETVEGALDKVNDLRGVKFSWKEDGRESYGVIAQEVETVLPQLVTENDHKSVNYNGLIGVLIEAVKEQQKQIESLTERIKVLES